MKKWYKSKTLWVNVITCISMILAEFIAKGLFVNYAEYWAAGLAIANIILRFITIEPITVKNGNTT